MGDTPVACYSRGRLRPSAATTVLAACFAAAICLSVNGAVLQAAKAGPSMGSEEEFLALNQRAMDKMMTGMMLPKPSGDIDRDFAAMMIPHHQGAIDMAQAELLYGRNERLRRIAQEIIVEQQQEITAMSLAIGQPLPPSSPAPDQGRPIP